MKAAPLQLGNGGNESSFKSLDDSIDSLPYVDALPENWRSGAEKLVREEVRLCN